MLGILLLPTLAMADDTRNLDLYGEKLFPPACYDSSKPECQGENIPTVVDALSKELEFNDQTMCGGWNTDEHVSPLPEGEAPWESPQDDLGMISKVTGVPGRNPIPLGNRESGMAWRIQDGDPQGDGLSMTMTKDGPKGNGFVYPDTARGLSTACADGKRETEVSVWCAKDGGNYDNALGLEGDGGAGPASHNCTRTVSYPHFESSVDAPACIWNNDEKEPKPLSENGCMTFSTWTNADRYTYADCKTVEEKTRLDEDGNPVLDEDGNPVTYFECVEAGRKWVCSDDWVEDPSATPTDEKKNTKICRGACCRCPGPACNKAMCMPAANASPWRSLYRSYDEVTTHREKIEEVQDDALADTSSSVHCYHWYTEYDTMRLVTQFLPCVIGNFETGAGPFNITKLKQTQNGRGRYGQPLNDTLPEARPYDEQKDEWYTRILGSFSFLKPKGDLTSAMLDLDPAAVLASKQTADGPWAKYGMQRAVDETVSNEKGRARSFAQWWQRYLTDGSRMFTPPTVRLRLPSNWTHSVEDLHPLGVAQTGREAPIEVQLSARNDLLGIVMEYLTRSLLLDVKEEPVPVVVPLGSPIEFRADAERWRTWKEQRKEAGLSVPAGVDGLIAKLEDYAQKVERVRMVRLELATLVSHLVQRQSDFLLTINAWSQQNEAAYQAFVTFGKRHAKELHDQWNELQADMVKFDDNVNMQWCRNDRFTLPVYSLLDGWYPTRQDTPYPYPINLSGGLPACSPNGLQATGGPALLPLCMTTPLDLTIDASTMKISSGAIVLPVFKPIQVRLDIPLPGSFSEDLPTGMDLDLPEFPEIPSFSERFALTFPTAETLSEPEGITAPQDDILEWLRLSMTFAKGFIAGMTEKYQKFWASLEFPNPPPQCEDGGTLDQLDCCSLSDNRCQHAEMDLIERYTRITARPAVQLKEDLQTQGLARSPMTADPDYERPFREKDGKDTLKNASCWAEDHVCQALLPNERKPKTGWQILQPPPRNVQQAIDSARISAREAVFDENMEFQGPHFVVPESFLLPSFDVPKETPLAP